MPEPYDVPTPQGGVSRAPPGGDTVDRPHSTLFGRRSLRSCCLAEQLTQFDSCEAQMVLGYIDAAAGDLGDLTDTQLALDLQKVGLALFPRQLCHGLGERSGRISSR